MARLAAALLAPLVTASCHDYDAALISACRAKALVDVHDPDRWGDYLRQLSAERAAAGDDPARRTFWSTADFSFVSRWAEANRGTPAKNQIYDDDYRVRDRITGAVVATVRNVSLRTSGFGATRFRSCLYDHSDTYADHWPSP